MYLSPCVQQIQTFFLFNTVHSRIQFNSIIKTIELICKVLYVRNLKYFFFEVLIHNIHNKCYTISLLNNKTLFGKRNSFIRSS